MAGSGTTVDLHGWQDLSIPDITRYVPLASCKRQVVGSIPTGGSSGQVTSRRRTRNPVTSAKAAM